MLILAGVSINLIIGNNGIISRAKDAKSATEQAAVNDKIEMNSLYDELIENLGEDDEAATVGALEFGAGKVYYASIDDDDTVDGVIYADLSVGGTGKWNNNDDSTFRVPTKTNLKSYYIKQDSYKGKFGTGPIIAPKPGTSGYDRFYVMALEDIDSNYYCWDEQSHEVFFGTSESFESGKENTRTLINYFIENDYSGEKGQNAGWDSNHDIWPNVKDQYNNRWFVPSREELACFGNNLGITSSNYRDFDLDFCWSSSQTSDSTIGAWGAYFGGGYMSDNVVYNAGCSVRLSTTF